MGVKSIIASLSDRIRHGAEIDQAIKAGRGVDWTYGASGTGAGSGVRVIGDGSANGGQPVFWPQGNVNTGWIGTAGGGGNGFPTSTAAINYAASVGDIRETNTVFSIFNFLRHNGPDVLFGVGDINTPEEVDLNHPLARKLRRPNPYHSWSDLFSATLPDYCLGEAFWIKKPSEVGDGSPGDYDLYYFPPWCVEPYRDKDSRNLIDGYWFHPNGLPSGGNRKGCINLPPQSVVHLRNGIDPRNNMRGMSDLKALLRTVYTDQEITTAIAAMTRNGGVVGAVATYKPTWVGPAGTAPDEAPPPLTGEQKQAAKREYADNFTGDRRGGLAVLDGDWTMQFPESALDATFFAKAKGIAQSDICAAIGISPVVFGFIVGTENASAKASHEDSRKGAYTGCIMPRCRAIGESLTIQVLPDFESDERFVVSASYKRVSALAEDRNAAAERTVKLVGGGIMTREEARQAEGLPDLPIADEFVLAGNGKIIAVDPAERAAVTPEPTTPAEPASNGDTPAISPEEDQP